MPERDHRINTPNGTFSPLISKMRAICSSWNNRKLSIKAKVTVFNTLISSLIQYMVMNAVTPPGVFTEVRKLASVFIWEGKKPKVAYNTLIKPIQEGGLKLMDLESRVKTNMLMWTRRIIDSPQSSSAQMIKKMSGEENMEVIFGAKRSTKTESLAPISPFYLKIMQTWMNAHNSPPEDEQGVRSEVLWDNYRISSPRAVLKAETWRTWLEAGVVTIHHLCHPSEKRLLGHQEISDKYGIKCNFLQALTIRSSIPHNWRTMLTANYQEQIGVAYRMKINNVSFDLRTSSPKLWYLEEARSKGHPFNREEGGKENSPWGTRNRSKSWTGHPSLLLRIVPLVKPRCNLLHSN